MKHAAGFSSPTLLAGLAAGLLALGLSVDLALTQPRAAEARKLSRRHGELLAQLGENARYGHERRFLSKWVDGGQSGADGASAELADPVAFLDGLLRETRLERLELGSVRESVDGELRSSGIFLRVTGSFAEILGFVRRLEEHPRLVIIDALTLASTNTPQVLEARLDVSVIDRQGRTEP